MLVGAGGDLALMRGTVGVVARRRYCKGAGIVAATFARLTGRTSIPAARQRLLQIREEHPLALEAAVANRAWDWIGWFTLKSEAVMSRATPEQLELALAARFTQAHAALESSIRAYLLAKSREGAFQVFRHLEGVARLCYQGQAALSAEYGFAA